MKRHDLDYEKFQRNKLVVVGIIALSSILVVGFVALKQGPRRPTLQASGQVLPLPPPTEDETGAIEGLVDELSSPIGTVGQPDFELTGHAGVRGDAIYIQGTTVEPLSVITLTLNDNIIFVVNSDAEGNWSRLVTTEELGIDPGKEVTIYIKGVAAIANLRSNQIDDVVTLYLAKNESEIIELESQEPLKQKGYINVTLVMWVILVFILILSIIATMSQKGNQDRS